MLTFSPSLLHSLLSISLQVYFTGTDNLKWGVALPGQTGKSIVVQLVVLRKKSKKQTKGKQDKLQYIDRVVYVQLDVT